MWNPWHGCHKFSTGCQHCYVYRTDGKYGKDSSVVTKTEKFDLPLQQKKNKTYKIPSGNMVYTCFTSDFLVEDADEWRPEAWEMMRIRQDLHFLFITKRIDRLSACPLTGVRGMIMSPFAAPWRTRIGLTTACLSIRLLP